MPYRNTEKLPERVWAMITNAAVTAARVQFSGVGSVLLQATADTTAPTDELGAVMFDAALLDGISTDTLLETFFPHVAGAVHLWAYAQGADVTMSISHA